MDALQDPLVARLSTLIGKESIAAELRNMVARVRRQLDASDRPMAWEVVPLPLFGGAPESIRSCWIFVIRAGAATGAERHPNSHQRSCSLLGSGTFEVHDGKAWHPHALTPAGDVDRRWVSIPPSTWHRLRVGPSEWGMVSFHTVVAGDLIEENPLDPDRLDGSTRQERYAGRR